VKNLEEKKNLLKQKIYLARSGREQTGSRLKDLVEEIGGKKPKKERGSTKKKAAA